ncbi:hypothetical protein Gotur_021856 [Gossypium turneri]
MSLHGIIHASFKYLGHSVVSIFDMNTLREDSVVRHGDVMGKASGDRHLALFVFVVYGLVVFLKALGYVSVELANFLSQIEKGVNPSPAVLVETIISLNFIRRKGDEHFLGCTQLLFLCMKSNFRCVYKRFRQVFVPSTRPIEEFLEIEWPPNQSIEELVQNLSTLTYQEIEWGAP